MFAFSESARLRPAVRNFLVFRVDLMMVYCMALVSFLR